VQNSGLKSLFTALVSAVIGGGLFAFAQLPMPWLLGAITGTAIAVMSGLAAHVPNRLRNLVLVVIGLMIGASLDPAILGHLARWPISLAGVVVYVVVVTSAQYFYFTRVGGYDPPTAYFSAAPGGFMAMTVIGSEYGGIERVIAMMHSVRIVLVVFTLVLGLEWLTGSGTGGGATSYVALTDIAWRNWGILVAAGVLGVFLARLLHLPGAALIGPLIVMGIIQISGFSETQVPSGPILVAEVILGSSIGAQFAGTSLAEIRRGLALSVTSTLAILGVSFGFALVMHALTGFAVLQLLLAYSPGGMSGISLIALALGIEPAFVAIHIMLRMLIILIAGPLFFRSYPGRRGKPRT
jgi:membrane AbrB-like protein